MKILIVAATALEVQPVLAKIAGVFPGLQSEDFVFTTQKHTFFFYLSGVGSLSTAVSLIRLHQKHKFDLWIQVGIAGTFQKKLHIGQVVEVISERFADLGIEQNDGSFSDIFEAGLADKDQHPFQKGLLVNPFPFSGLEKVRGLTVNKVSGSEKSIFALTNKYGAEIESMEGAGFFYAALTEGIPFCQLRAVSNDVEVRDVTLWNIPLALENLSEKLAEILQEIGHSDK